MYNKAKDFYNFCSVWVQFGLFTFSLILDQRFVMVSGSV